MSKTFTTDSGDTLAFNLFVKADGKTVCESTDRDVAEMKYAAGTKLTEAQRSALIFPAVAETVPDAEQRSVSTLPDAEVRHSGSRKRK